MSLNTCPERSVKLISGFRLSQYVNLGKKWQCTCPPLDVSTIFKSSSQSPRRDPRYIHTLGVVLDVLGVMQRPTSELITSKFIWRPFEPKPACLSLEFFGLFPVSQPSSRCERSTLLLFGFNFLAFQWFPQVARNSCHNRLPKA